MIKRHISTKFLLITVSLLLIIALVLPLFVTAPSATQTTEAPTHAYALISSEYNAGQSISWVNWGSSPVPLPPVDDDGSYAHLVNWGS